MNPETRCIPRTTLVIRNAFLILISIGAQIVKSQTVTYYQTGEEFVGPFASWKDIKKDFGAKGDGSTDDAPAINAALAACRTTGTNTWNVIFFPAGDYHIASSLVNPGRSGGGDDYSGMAIIGEDPATTTISWQGAADGTMFKLDGWYMRVSRLTFAGNGKNCTGISRDGGFGTGCEFSDLVFKDMKNGIDFSAPVSGQGQAENAIIRCTFRNCVCGMLCCNWNSLDEWVWYCLFEDCGYGIQSCIGYFQVYGSVFLRSKTIDINTAPYMQTIAENTSINSKAFYNGEGYLRGNKIYNTLDTISTSGTVLVDNVIRSRSAAGPAAPPTGLSIGNTFTVGKWPVRPPTYDRYYTSDGMHLTWAIDNDPNTSFYDWDAVTNPPYGCNCGPFDFTWTCPEGTRRAVTKYTITSGSKALRDLKRWKLQGSNSWGTSWMDLDTKTSESWSSRRLKREFAISNTTAYGMYRIYAEPVVSENSEGIEIGELELLDAAGVDITQDANGLAGGRQQSWGKYYPVDNKRVDPSTIPVPDRVSLPGTPQNPNRSILEVRKGTGDDAAEIQRMITAACSTSVHGQRAVVHIPKGTFEIARTITVPAGKNIQIIGDGAGSGQITRLNWSGSGSGPLMSCLGPSKVTIKDMTMRVPFDNGPEALVIENADQVGGRIYGCEFEATGPDASRQASIGMLVDGVEQSNVTLICGGAGGCWDAGILAKGGPVLSAGGTTPGVIALLSGAQSNCQNLLDVSNGGRVVSEGTWYEGELSGTRTSGLINLNGSKGSVSIACMSWHLAASPIPMLNLNNFTGTFTCIANGFDDRDKNAGLAISGNGSNCNVFAACNAWSNTPSTTDSLWQDKTTPAAQAVLLNSGAYDNVTNKAHNSAPDSTFVLAAMAQLRAVRAEPPMDTSNPGITDVKFFRVKISGAKGKTVFHLARGSSSGIVSRVMNGGPISPVRTQKLLLAGTKPRIAVGTAQVILFGMDGRVVFAQKTGSATDCRKAQAELSAFRRNHILIMRSEVE